jgi:hypothetical protein
MEVDVYFQSYSSAGVPSGANVKVTTASSDESDPKTNNPNQYGDYMGIAASGGFAFPVWTDHRPSKSGTEEIFVDPPLPIPVAADAPAPAAALGAGAARSLGAGVAASAALGVPPADLPWFWGSWLDLLPQTPSFDVIDAWTAASTTPTASHRNILTASVKPSSDGAGVRSQEAATEDALFAI